MTDVHRNLNPAERASEEALKEVFECLAEGKSFRLEAGAGAGKTYSLVKVLQHLIERDRLLLPQLHQQIACITFTNVAKTEIELRVDRSPLVYCDTIHGFCWSLISGFQKELRSIIAEADAWQELLEEVDGMGDQVVGYTLGYRRLSDVELFLHHDDVISLTAELFRNAKFRLLLAARYPVILVDEYQDTNAEWMAAFTEHVLGVTGAPLCGLFGDHWQKIYGDGCGAVESPKLVEIGKKANFRSATVIVDCLNRMRPELTQNAAHTEAAGTVRLLHCNSWSGERQTSSHWKGDLPTEQVEAALASTKELLEGDGWEFESGSTKVLMLTHRVLAEQQGYGSLPGIFRYNEAFAKKEHGHIAFFVDVLEPCCEAYKTHKYGEMFNALGSKRPLVRRHKDKEQWSASMDRLIELRANGTVGDVVDHLRDVRRPRLPESVERREVELAGFEPESGEEMTRSLVELKKLREIPYLELVELTKYLSGHSPFETKHGVKGAEFENVLVVVGRGWNHYNFNEYFELANNGRPIPARKQKAFERNRNLFYVVCSRPILRLCILFTQELSSEAIDTLMEWFGEKTVESLRI